MNPKQAASQLGLIGFCLLYSPSGYHGAHQIVPVEKDGFMNVSVRFHLGWYAV